MSTRNFIIFFFCIFSFSCLLFFIFGYDAVLQEVWGIPTMKPYFGDIRTITGVNETLTQGLNPLVSNPGDPWNRPMNYPKIWQYIAELLKFDQSFGIYFGFINVSLFVAGFLMICSKIKLSNLTGFVLLTTFFSPASVLAMERGNIDMIMFFLLSFALSHISKPKIYSTIILAASILKIFPIFAIVGLLKHSKYSFIKYFYISIFVFTFYVFFTINDIILIKNGTPQSISLSYGMNIVWMGFESKFGVNIGLLFRIATYLYIIALLTLIVVFVNKSKRHSSSTVYIDSFRVGSAIFISTFLLSNNWDYRLIFLIFCLPQIITWIGSKEKIMKVTSLLAAISIVYTMYYLDISRLGSTIAWLTDELSNWLLFSALSFLFIATLPDWVLSLMKILKCNEERS